MMRMRYVLALTLMVQTAVPASAQDGVFDMGVLGVTGSIDHATQQAEKQAGIKRETATKGAARWQHRARSGRRSTTFSPEQRVAVCVSARRSIGVPGADPRLPRLVAACQRAGY